MLTLTSNESQIWLWLEQKCGSRATLGSWASLQSFLCDFGKMAKSGIPLLFSIEKLKLTVLKDGFCCNPEFFLECLVELRERKLSTFENWQETIFRNDFCFELSGANLKFYPITVFVPTQNCSRYL